MFHDDIEKLTKENDNFRKVVYTGKYSQVVLMSIPAGNDIGEEVHPQTDQILCLVEGEGEAILNGGLSKFAEHDLVFVPAGTRHNFRNTGDEPLQLFTIYSPPIHAEGTIHKTKEDAQKEEKSSY